MNTNRGNLLSKGQQVWPRHCSPKQTGAPNKEPGACILVLVCNGFLPGVGRQATKSEHGDTRRVPGVYLPISYS